MTNQTVGHEALQELYDKWFDLRLKDIGKLEKIKSEIDEIVRHLKGYIFTQPDYWIISLGHDVIFNRLNEANVSLDQLENIDRELTDKQKYYYFLFKGSYLSTKNNLTEAINYFQKAKELLHIFPNQIEEAEFYYKIGSLDYLNDNTLDSIYHTSIAISLFKTKGGYERRIATCEVVLGLNSIDLHQWAEAEERFYSALNYANKVEDINLKGLIYHDLGLLYAEQSMSKAAIHWLQESTQHKKPSLKTLYLLCKENFKLHNYIEADNWFEEGIKLSHYMQSPLYEEMFRVLKVIYTEKDEIVYENSLIHSLHFFQKEESWVNIEEITRYLAEFYSEKKRYKKSVEHFQLLLDAQKKIKELEALK